MINYDEVIKYQERDNCVFLEIRTKKEHDRGAAIPNSLNIELKITITIIAKALMEVMVFGVKYMNRLL